MKVTKCITRLIIALSIVCSGVFACPTCKFLKERSDLAEQETANQVASIGEMEIPSAIQLAHSQQKASPINTNKNDLPALLAVQDIQPILDKDLDLMDGIDDHDRDIVPGLAHEKK